MSQSKRTKITCCCQEEKRCNCRRLKLFNNMSMASLKLRQRAQSTVSLRKRIVRTNSQEKGDLKKSSTMTSFRPKLERLIQEGKIQQLMSQDPSSKAHLYYTNTVQEMEKELASTKKSLSSLVIKARDKERAINNIKNNIRRVEHQIQIIRKEASSVAQRHNGTNDDLQAKRDAFQAIFWDQKIFSHLKARGYHDEVFLKGRHQALQRVMNIELENRRLLQNKYRQLKQLNKELRGHRGEAERIAREQAIDKNEFIAMMEADMSERELMGELKNEKYRREGQINEIAPSLIEREELLRILEVLYAHRILSHIVKVKSNSLIKQYQQVNRAYNYIKSNSNIVDPDKILKRMEEHDKLYDDALKRVNALEAQLKHNEENLQDCSLSKNKILSQEGQVEELPKDYYQGLEVDRYELLLSEREKIRERNSADQVLRLNVIEWGVRMFERLGITMSENNGFLECLTDLVVRLRQQK